MSPNSCARRQDLGGEPGGRGEHGQDPQDNARPEINASSTLANAKVDYRPKRQLLFWNDRLLGYVLGINSLGTYFEDRG